MRPPLRQRLVRDQTSSHWELFCSDSKCKFIEDAGMKATSKIAVFDTTLRDGEQAAGTRLGSRDKITLARQLARLKVDIIEAGFPASSPEDFDAVRKIAQEIKGPDDLRAVARRCRRHRVLRQGARQGRPPAHSHRHRRLRHSHHGQVPRRALWQDARRQEGKAGRPGRGCRKARAQLRWRR